jgi:hypothetical protein
MSIFDNMKSAVTSKAATQIFLAKQHSPKVLFAVGTIGVVGSVVLACRATLKLEPVLDKLEKFEADARDNLGEEPGPDDLADFKKDLNKQRLKTAGEIAKLYAVPAGTLALSIAALTGSHVILSNRNTAAMATIAALDKAYNKYRSYIKTEYGDDVDWRAANGAEKQNVEIHHADGTVTTESKYIVVDRDGMSPYSVPWDETSKFFSRIPGENPMTLTMRQNWANDKLNAKGFLFLNDVREMLGFEPVPEGQYVGWLRKDHPEAKDGYVSFGIYDNDPEGYEQFQAGRNMYIILDFNVDGFIVDKIGKKNPKLPPLTV